MSAPGFVDTWPHPFRPLGPDGNPSGAAVEVFQLRPDLVEPFGTWSGGTVVLLNGGPVVLLTGPAPAGERLVGLGDFGVRTRDGVFYAEPADGFYSRYTPGSI